MSTIQLGQFCERGLLQALSPEEPNICCVLLIYFPADRTQRLVWQSLGANPMSSRFGPRGVVQLPFLQVIMKGHLNQKIQLFVRIIAHSHGTLS